MNENSENQSKICTLVTKKRRTGPLVSGKEDEKILYAFRFSRIRIHDRKNGIILHHRDIQKSPAPEVNRLRGISFLLWDILSPSFSWLFSSVCLLLCPSFSASLRLCLSSSFSPPEARRSPSWRGNRLSGSPGWPLREALCRLVRHRNPGLPPAPLQVRVHSREVCTCRRTLSPLHRIPDPLPS